MPVGDEVQRQSRRDNQCNVALLEVGGGTGSQSERRDVKADPPRLLIAPPAPQAVERPLGLIARAARVPSTRDRGESCAKRVLPTVLDTARAVRGTVLSRCKWSTTATLHGLHAH